MDRTERLLDLVALMLDAKKPLSWTSIYAAFPDDYGGSDEAAERKFERDKAELLELGIPITFVQASDEHEAGYVLDRQQYYLPEPGLTPEELAVLYAAGSASLASGAFPGRQDLAHALRKIGFFAEGPLPVPKVRLELGALAQTKELPGRLELLWSAINHRKSVDVAYFSPHTRQLTQRRVDPYGLALRRGLWSLVGYCHLRQQIRTFHVHRVRELKVNAKSPKSVDFEVPPGFALREYVAHWPWQHRFHAPIEVELELLGSLQPLARQLFPAEVSTERVTVMATDVEGLLKYVMSLGPQARVVGPAEVKATLRAMAQRVLDAHAPVEAP
jgi:proteasome accessory factor B